MLEKQYFPGLKGRKVGWPVPTKSLALSDGARPQKGPALSEARPVGPQAAGWALLTLQ